MRRAAAVVLLACVMPALAAAPDRGLGINLHGVRYWAPTLPFTDVFKQSGEWIAQRAGSQAWNTGERLELDDGGWVRVLSPGQEAATVVMGGGRYPAGRYRVTYEGQGELFFGLDAKIVERRGRELVVEVTPKSSVILKILRTEAGDPLRNIRMLLPGFDPARRASEFNPVYLDYLRGFGVIRFMDWANANENDVVEWGARARLGSASQHRKQGVALEHMIDFARQSGAAPWFTVPHAASDDYVRRMAALVRERLAPGGKFYLEYSNEVWNSIFPQHAHAAREAARLRLADADEFYLRRSLDVFRLFEQEFGGSARIVRVLAGQAVNLSRSRRMLERPGVRGAADAYAIAPYFGYTQQLEGADGISIDELMKRLESGIEETASVMRANAALAAGAGLALVAYEAGQHVTNPRGNDGFCASINRHPRMEELYRRYLESWERETSGALMMIFGDMSVYGASGCWGLAEYHAQPLAETPKLRAVRAELQRRQAGR